MKEQVIFIFPVFNRGIVKVSNQATQNL